MTLDKGVIPQDEYLLDGSNVIGVALDVDTKRKARVLKVEKRPSSIINVSISRFCETDTHCVRALLFMNIL